MKFTEGRGFGGGKPLFKAVSFPRFSFQKNFDNRHDGVRFDDREFENEEVVGGGAAFAEVRDVFFFEEDFAAVVEELCVVDFAREAGEFEILEGVFEEVDVEAFAVFALGEFAAVRAEGEEVGFCHGAAVDGAAVVFHPAGVGGEGGFGAVVEVAAGGGAYVHEEVAADGDGVDEHLDEHFGALPGCFVAVVAPGAGEGLAGFPCDEFTGLRVADPFLRLVLFGGPEILFDFGAVVYDYAGLETAGCGYELFGFPVILALALHPFLAGGGLVAGVGEVEPEDVYLAVVRQELGDLISHVLGVLVHIAAFRLLFGVRIVTARVEHINREFGMMPVDQRVVETDVQSLGAESVDILADKVASRRSVRALIIGVLRVEHAEALMMLCREDDILHPRSLGLTRPFLRVVEVGIEVLEVLLVLLLGGALKILHPLMARGKRIESPMDEHTETVMSEPFSIAGSFSRYVAGHFFCPPYKKFHVSTCFIGADGVLYICI